MRKVMKKRVLSLLLALLMVVLLVPTMSFADDTVVAVEGSIFRTVRFVLMYAKTATRTIMDICRTKKSHELGQ